MNAKRLAMSVAMVLVVAGASGSAEAFETPYHGTVSGSFFTNNTQIDTNHDTVKAEWNPFFALNTNLGKVTAQALVENSPLLPPPNNCSQNTPIFEIKDPVVGRAVHRFPDGDLLFLAVLHRTGCLDLTDLNNITVSLNEAGTFIGGTGRFADVTGGSFETHLTGAFLVHDLDAGQAFGHFTGEFSGTIITPNPIPHGRGR